MNKKRKPCINNDYLFTSRPLINLPYLFRGKVGFNFTIKCLRFSTRSNGITALHSIFRGCYL